jgi:hypothetical protein
METKTAIGFDNREDLVAQSSRTVAVAADDTVEVVGIGVAVVVVVVDMVVVVAADTAGVGTGSIGID